MSSGRARTIKPELLEDAITAGLSDTAFRLFIACIVSADDHGNFRGEVKRLEKDVYWSAIPERSVAKALTELTPLVQFYVVRGQFYGHIKNWEKHQYIQRRGTPRVPLHTDVDAKYCSYSDEQNLADLDLDQEKESEQDRARPALPDTAAPVVRIHPDPEVQKVVEAVLAEPRLRAIAPIDVRDTVARAMPVGNRKATAWYLQSVQDAAAVTESGELSSVTLKRLWSFLRATKAPRKDPDAPSSAPYHRETREEPPSGIVAIPRVEQGKRAQEFLRSPLMAGVGKVMK